MVGAGVGGLACAIELAGAGWEVTLLERGRAGGKVRTVDAGGLAVDAGPTVLTMKWVFEELFARAGASLADYVTLERADVLARHAWSDGSRLDLFSDLERSADAIGRLSGPAEAKRYREFSAYAARIYETVEQPFLRSQRPTLGDMLRQAGKLGLGAFAKIDAHRSMARALEGHFQDARLRQLFGRYATYCGSSPFAAPATYNLIAHVEALGVHRVVGGMVALADGLRRLAIERGVILREGAEVASVLVRGGRAHGVELRSGEQLHADAVISNADVSALGEALLGEGAARAVKATARQDRSLSAVTWALAARPSGARFPLLHHNVFFSDDYPAEFAALAAGRVPAAPTVYLCAQDRGDRPEARATGEWERMLLIVNAPATGDDPAAWTHEERDRCEKNAFTIMEKCGLQLEVGASVLTTPAEFHRAFPGTGGALYGPNAHSPMSSLSRQGARTKVAGLYIAGGSVHPGPGVPMAALSGRLAAESVRTDLASTARSRPAATSGSTWTA